MIIIFSSHLFNLIDIKKKKHLVTENKHNKNNQTKKNKQKTKTQLVTQTCEHHNITTQQ